MSFSFLLTIIFLGNLRPHATYCSFLSQSQHLQARYERKKKIISHTTGTRTRDLAIREQCSNQLSYSMTLIHSDGKSIPLRSIYIWLASYWQLTPIKRALGHSLDIMGSASNFIHCEQIQIAISNLDFTDNFKVLGNLRSHATYCSFLSQSQHLQARYERKKKSSVSPPGLEPGTLLFASNALTN